MTHEREKLPETRTGINHKVKIGGVKIFITVNTFKDGRPAEIFIKTGIINSVKDDKEQEFGLQGWCNSLCILMSLCLQAGVELEIICGKLQYQRFKPDGRTTTDHKYATSIVDYLARWLLETYPVKEKK